MLTSKSEDLPPTSWENSHDNASQKNWTCGSRIHHQNANQANFISSGRNGLVDRCNSEQPNSPQNWFHNNQNISETKPALSSSQQLNITHSSEAPKSNSYVSEQNWFNNTNETNPASNWNKQPSEKLARNSSQHSSYQWFRDSRQTGYNANSTKLPNLNNQPSAWGNSASSSRGGWSSTPNSNWN